MSLLSERLIEQRNKMNWTRKRAVSELQVPYSTYAGYEQGYREPDIGTLKKIATAYNTTIDYLTGRTDDPSSSKDDSKISKIDLEDPVFSLDGKTITGETAEEIRNYARYLVNKDKEKERQSQ